MNNKNYNIVHPSDFIFPGASDRCIDCKADTTYFVFGYPPHISFEYTKESLTDISKEPDLPIKPVTLALGKFISIALCIV